MLAHGTSQLHRVPLFLSFTHLSGYNSWQVIHIDPADTEEMDFWEEHNNNNASMARNNFSADKVVALVCQNFSCSPPVTDPISLENLLLEKPSSTA